MKQEAYSIGNVVVCATHKGIDEYPDIDTYVYDTEEMADAVAAATNMRIVRLP